MSEISRIINNKDLQAMYARLEKVERIKAEVEDGKYVIKLQDDVMCLNLLNIII